MTNWMNLHDASCIQSTQALAGYDVSSRSFPARAQRAAARNSNNEREEESNGIQVNGGAIVLGLLGVAAGLAWIHRDKLLDPEWRKEQQDNVKGFLEDGNQRLEVVHSQQTSNQLEGRLVPCQSADDGSTVAGRPFDQKKNRLNKSTSDAWDDNQTFSDEYGMNPLLGDEHKGEYSESDGCLYFEKHPGKGGGGNFINRVVDGVVRVVEGWQKWTGTK